MRYSLVFYVKGYQRWLYHDDREVILLVATMMKGYHLPFVLMDYRTVMIEYHGN